MHSRGPAAAAAHGSSAVFTEAAVSSPIELDRQAPNQEEEHQQQVNLQAHLSGWPSGSEASSGGGSGGVDSRSSSVAASHTLADRSFSASASQPNWPNNSSSRQIKEPAAAAAAAATTSHRIKVTLSLPRGSINEQTNNNNNSNNNSGNGNGNGERPQLPAGHFDSKRRQSTATLISAAESSSSLLRRPTQTSQTGCGPHTALVGASVSSFGLAQLPTTSTSSLLLDGSHSAATASVLTSSGHSQAAAATHPKASAAAAAVAAAATSVDRAVQERELRRIASQRVTKAGGPVVVERPPSQTPPPPAAPALAPKQKQQQQQLDVLVPNHKQLAIYINGKIRSNSIFCQSSSLSDSFHNIFNRFQDKQADSAGQQAEQQHATSSSSSVRNKHSGSGKARTAKRKGAKKVGKEVKRPRDHDNDNERLFAGKQEAQLGLRVRKLIGKYLPSNLSNNNPSKSSSSSSSSSSLSSTSANGTSNNNNNNEDENEDGDEGIDNKNQESIEKKLRLKEETANQQQLTTASYKLNPSSMFLRKAMRYYRLWIYCTNVTILLGTLLFIIAVLYVASDYRLPLIIGGGDSSSSSSSLVYADDGDDSDKSNEQNEEEKTNIFITRNFPISFTEPSMLFAYVAVAIQAGILQIIGCLGAVRMKEKFIQLFWYMILALTVLDIVFLVYWLLRYDLMIKSLNEHMRFRLNEHFGTFDENFPSSLSGLGDYRSRQQDSTAEESIKFDKIFTNIINRIQSDSRCCGIASPLDYRRTKWRQVKLKQLENKLNWTASTIAELSPYVRSAQEQQFKALLSRVPLVAGSCCRRRDDQQQKEQDKRRRPVILDDSELPAKVRVPAWAPSSVAEDLQDSRNQQHRARLKLAGDDGGEREEFDQLGPRDRDREKKGKNERVAESLADIIDQRWTSSPPTSGSSSPNGWSSMAASNDNEDIALLVGRRDGNYDGHDDGHHDDTEQQDRGLSKQQRRLLAKQDNYNLPAASARRPSRERRWTVESSVDSQERVLSRLIEDDEPDAEEPLPSLASMQAQPPLPSDDYYTSEHKELPSRNGEHEEERGINLKGGNSNSLRENEEEEEAAPMSKLASLRRALFQWKSPSIPSSSSSSDSLWSSEHSDNTEARTKNDTSQTHTFRWPNKLQLNYGQYKTLESYLLAEEETTRRQRDNSADRPRRSIFSSFIGVGSSSESTTASPTTTTATPPIEQDKQAAARQQALKQLKWALESDQELGCAPRSHFDNATIYTRGCHEPIRSWLDRSGHILFVTGFCVLSMLKLFSLLLLRLELREMIHKIRVLKGMATEYNALHDLEAYLPRPSVCAQAAELTPSGVTSAVLPAASVTPVASSAGGAHPGTRICGGSFSEAVAAATAAAAAANMNNNLQQLSAGPGPGRASSMKTVTNMLTPSMCPRSSSVSAAQLQALQQRFLNGSSSLRSDLFHQSGPMSRRHTAVSVCPAAAAAAAAAAHHLMSRRGTYVPTAFPFVSPSLGLNLSQHRHSAHTVHTLSNSSNNSMLMLLNPKPKQRRPSSTSSAQRQQQHHHHHQHHRTSLAVEAQNHSRHFLGDMSARNPSAASSNIAHEEAGGQQSCSMDSNQSGGRCFLSTTASGGGGGGGCCHQLEAPNANDQQLLYPTFKRQSSTGAQSACNFSLDPRPAASLLAESRRSIH